MSVIQIARETALVFGTSGQTVNLTMTSLANNAGRVSSQYDRGTGLASDEYFGRASIKLAVAAAIGATARIYVASSDGTDVDGGLSATDAALPSVERLRNLIQVATIVADAATVGPFFAPIPIFRFEGRYMQFVIYNEMGQALTATAADHYIKIQAIRPEIT